VDVNVTAYQLPVINRELMNSKQMNRKKLGDLFDELRGELRERLMQVIVG